MDRRDLLVKLSAALTLAAGSSALALIGDDEPRKDTASASGFDLSGIWHSRYVYYLSGRSERLVGERYVVLRQQNGKLAGESMPAANESILRLDLVVRGTVAIGTWSERTSPSGYYRGRIYHSAIQLVVDPARVEVRGGSGGGTTPRC